MNIKETALRTIQIEAESVAGLQHYIDAEFEKAVDAVHSSAGRLVVSGIGKSAIISQKIVATLNSTGTPALFMHAADAIHGDLGMIQEADVVMIISKSGESPEIKVLVPLIKSFKNIIIGVIGNTDSFLAKNADIVLNTSVSQEACLNNLAPTSSTTAQMVMGDALAICLMEINNFSGRDFAKYHPGGNIGKRLYLRVADLYKLNSAPCVNETAAIKDVIIEITKGRLGATAVVDEANKIAGIITDGDIRRLLEKTDDIRNIKASDFLIKNPKYILEDALAVEALEKMKQYDINQLLVIDNLKNYSGIIHLHDLIREGII